MSAKKLPPRASCALPDATPEVVETFLRPRIDRHDGPSFVNYLRLRKYRVTIELIDEPVAVLRARLVKLWRESKYNSHSTDSFRRAAEELGFSLADEERGRDAYKCERCGAHCESYQRFCGAACSAESEAHR